MYQLMKSEIEISKITAVVKTHGNGCHVILPRNWLGKKVVIMPIETMEAYEKQENKFLDKVSKEVGENLTKTRGKGKK